jgi:anti-sigma regulatory factor (Ser/Thr protein kinase)
VARRFAREVLAGHGAGAEILDRAELLISELVTNAVVHAGSPVWLSVTAAGGAVHIEVEDNGGGQVARRRPGDLRGCNAGYGLWLVDSLADSWGVEHAGERQPGPGDQASGSARGNPKRVWLRLPLPC